MADKPGSAPKTPPKNEPEVDKANAKGVVTPANENPAAPPVREPGSPEGPEHNENGGISQDDRDDLLITHLAQGRSDNAAMETAMEVVRGIRKRRTRNRNECETDGFSLKEFDNILADELKPRHVREEEAAIRTNMRRAANMPVLGARQLDMFAVQAKVAKPDNAAADLAAARQDGFMAGLRGDPKVVPDFIAKGLSQPWLEEWDAGQARLAKAMDTKNRLDAKK